MVPLARWKSPFLFCQRLQLDSDKLCDDNLWANYFKDSAEIVTATSLSKNAKLLSLAIVQRRELADMTEVKKENKGWFKKKDKGSGGNLI